MRFEDLKIGKRYQKTMKLELGRAREGVFQTYVYLVVSKNQDLEEVQASIVPEVGKPMAPMTFKKGEFARWKPV